VGTYDENDFKSQPSAVHDKPAPLYLLQPNGIKGGRRENSRPTKELENSDAFGTLREREQLD
jgi:hypothetical protein